MLLRLTPCRLDRWQSPPPIPLAVCSRIRCNGVVEIEIDLGDPRLPKSAFTADQMRQAEATSRTRLGAPRPRGSTDRLGGGAKRASATGIAFDARISFQSIWLLSDLRPGLSY
jgi:hypothetical protein